MLYVISSSVALLYPRAYIAIGVVGQSVQLGEDGATYLRSHTLVLTNQLFDTNIQKEHAPNKSGLNFVDGSRMTKTEHQIKTRQLMIGLVTIPSICPQEFS